MRRRTSAPTLETFLATYGSLDVLAVLYLASLFGYRLPGGRHQDKLAALVVEWTQAAALTTEHISASADRPRRTARVAELVTAAEVDAASVFRTAPPAGGDELWEARARLHSWQRGGYDPGPTRLELNRVDELFTPFDGELDRELGITAQEAVAIATAYSMLHRIRLAWFFRYPAEILADGGAALFASLDERVARGKALRTIPNGLGHMLAVGRADIHQGASAWAQTNLGRVSVRLSAVDSFNDLFSLRFADSTLPSEPLRRVWAVRDRPLMRIGEDAFLLVVPYNLAHCVAPVFERALRAAPGVGQRYDKAKALYVEATALAALRNGLRPSGAWRKLSYIPVGQTQRMEGDGLVIVDSTVLALETKAVELSPSARMGQPDAVIGKLQAAVTEGVDQAWRTVEATAAGVVVTGVTSSDKREEIVLPRDPDYVPLVVTLEALGAVTAGLGYLIRNDGRPRPVVVNLDDLEWIVDECDLPAEFMHYLTLRQRVSRLPGLAAFDEADWFALYRMGGPREFLERLEFMSKFRTARAMLIGTHARRGSSFAASPHPLYPVLLLLDAHRPPGWLAVSYALLELDPEVAFRIWRVLETGTGRRRWLLQPLDAETPLVELVVGLSEPSEHQCVRLLVEDDLASVAIEMPAAP